MVFLNQDKIIIQKDYKEQSWSAYKIWKKHPSKKWEYSSVKPLLKKFRETDSVDRRHGSGWPRTFCTEENMDLIEKLVFSQEERPYMHLVPRRIAEQTGISRSLIRRMVKKEILNSSHA